jgi:hypothetical protein
MDSAPEDITLLVYFPSDEEETAARGECHCVIQEGGGAGWEGDDEAMAEAGGQSR